MNRDVFSLYHNSVESEYALTLVGCRPRQQARTVPSPVVSVTRATVDACHFFFVRLHARGALVSHSKDEPKKIHSAMVDEISPWSR